MRWIKRWEGQAWSAVVTLLVGGAAVYGSSVALHQWRADKTLELQKRWSSPVMQARHDRVVDALLCRFGQGRLQGRHLTLDTVNPGSDNYYGLDSDLSGFVEFFDEARACMETRSCDVNQTCRLFQRDARSTLSLFRRAIDRQRLLFGDRTWGQEIADFTAYCEAHADPLPERDRASNAIEGIAWSATVPRSELSAQMLSEFETDGYAAAQRDAACTRMRPENIRRPGGD